MKTVILSVVVCGMLTGGLAPRAHAVAGIADTVFIAGNLDPAQLGQWAMETEKWAAQVEQATRVATAAKSVVDFAGNPKLAVQNLGEISGIVRSIGRMTGDDMTANSMADGVDAVARIDFARQRIEANVGSTMTVWGQPQNRDVSLYQAVLATEQVVQGTRTILDTSRKQEQDINKKLAEAEVKLDAIKAKPNPTQNELLTMQLEVDRLRAMLLALQVRTQSAVADAQLKKEEMENKEKIAQTAAAEQATAEGSAQITKAQQVQRNAGQNLSAGFRPVAQRTAIDYNAAYSPFALGNP